MNEPSADNGNALEKTLRRSSIGQHWILLAMQTMRRLWRPIFKRWPARNRGPIAWPHRGNENHLAASEILGSPVVYQSVVDPAFIRAVLAAEEAKDDAFAAAPSSEPIVPALRGMAKIAVVSILTGLGPHFEMLCKQCTHWVNRHSGRMKWQV
jgi:hypothetical protein